MDAWYGVEVIVKIMVKLLINGWLIDGHSLIVN
jgi:hypothetical protein